MATFTRQAHLLKCLGHPTRLRMLHLLEQDEACVCHLAAALHASQPAISQHLMALREAGAVTRRREGKNIYYRLSRHEIPGLLDIVNSLAGGASGPTRQEVAEDCPCPQCRARHDLAAESRGNPAPSTNSVLTGEKSQ